eukprot:TRINITY_DN8167_c0_g2_i1.p1 TRINITY_DN8167_c0_g2~~TRINITY_DN8167_c0_g2_i1.p1  ORF type:complete len:269 (-),score=44.08 TRINITY_DN8167_c0_g2_i1:57-863(-)
MKSVFVTGGNSGIGLALCKQLATEDGYYVFMGSRSLERGQEAFDSIGIAGKGEVVQCDIANPESVAEAAKTVQAKLSAPLYALINNAGTGGAHGATTDEMYDVNVYGTKCMTDAFLPLLQPEGGRIVCLASGIGGMWLGEQSPEIQEMLTSGKMDWAAINTFVKEHRHEDTFPAYGLSKAMVMVYCEWMARAHPKIITSSVSPGLVATKMVPHGSKTPEEATVSTRHCLNNELKGNGFFYGSDAVRSPFYPMRNPGQAEFTGTYPWTP